MLRTSDLDYELPPDRIATRAAEPRESARLLVTGRSGDHMDDRAVRDLPELLREGDVLVFNTTRVLPARLIGKREGTGGKVEGLFLSQDALGRWRCLLRGGHLRAGAAIRLDQQDQTPSDLVLRLVDRPEDDPSAWVVDVQGSEGDLEADLGLVGKTPLPPYILKARSNAGERVDDVQDRARYQTVFAERSSGRGQGGVEGSVAAPTAGLHFSEDLLGRLRARGIQRVDVRLHVGTGTFRPVESEFVQQHPMHEEWCSMTGQAIQAVIDARREGRRIIPVGTTSARTLESYASLVHSGSQIPSMLATRILIVPGHTWQWCDGLLTNFHLPRSTLMAMVGALLDGGIGRLKRLYAHAVEQRYRFYSYGDAMLVLPAVRAPAPVECAGVIASD